MKELKLTYSQLRDILGLVITNQTTRVTLGDLLSGKQFACSELELLDLIYSSKIDLELLQILTGEDASQLDAFAAVEVIAAFFAYMRASWPKCKPWLGSLGYAVQARATRSKGSK